MIVNRYETLITAVDLKPSKMLALKFKMLSGKLYAYNFYLRDENRKLLEVSAINGVDIDTIIDELDENDFYDIDKMKRFGIDTTDSFLCTFLDEGKEIQFDVLDFDSDQVFYKAHDINQTITNSNVDIPRETVSTDNIMVDYAGTNIKVLLNALSSMSMSLKDKENINSFLEELSFISDSYSNVNNNLDMIFLSTQLLMLGDKFDHVPEQIENLMSRVLIFNFGDEELSTGNNAILTDDEVDYKKVLIMMRNSIAHSNYKVLDNGLVEFYNEGKQKMNFTISKKDIHSLFEHIYDYYFMEGVFPIILDGTYIFDNKSFDNSSLLEYLNKLELLNVSNSEMRICKDKDEQLYLDRSLGSDIYDLKLLTRDNLHISVNRKDEIIRRYELSIKKHLSDGCELLSFKLNSSDIEYILSSIKEMDESYFYSLGKTSQIEVINNLVYKKYNRDYYLQKNMRGIIDADYFNHGSLTAKPSNYINYKTKMELTITSLLNNIFLYCYNQNVNKTQDIDGKDNPLLNNSDKILFPNEMYQGYIDWNKGKFFEGVQEITDYRYLFDTLLQVSSLHMTTEDEFIKVNKSLSKAKFGLNVAKKNMERASKIMNGDGDSEEKKIVNSEIFREIRHSNAHGNLKTNIKDINDIWGAQLHIVDEYKGKIEYESTVTFGGLMSSIMESSLLRTMLVDNKNFNQHGRR